MSKNDAVFEVPLYQGRILTTKFDLSVKGKAAALVAVGDPTTLDFALVNNRQIRVIGMRIGTTDLAIIAPDGQTYNFRVNVVPDLDTLRTQLHAMFPDASLRLGLIRENIVVEGEARDSLQVARIIQTIEAFLLSIQNAQQRRQMGGLGGAMGGGAMTGIGQPGTTPGTGTTPGVGTTPGTGTPGGATGGARLNQPGGMGMGFFMPQVINLLRVPGSKQVLLKVRVAELNRSALRQVGTDILVSGGSGARVGTQLGSASNIPTVTNGASNGRLTSAIQSILGTSGTAFAIFEESDFALFFSALRRNTLLRILAEPNLVALNGHAANFLAGGEFPVPVTQTTVSGGATPNVQFREFGVRLGFLPTILDGDVIRLQVDPEVSNIDFTLATTLVAGGSPVPGLNTRKAHTVVELREGQTLAIAGLLQVTLDGTTARLPFLGDLPVLGPFFGNTTGNRIEKELVVLVTPYLVEPTAAPCGPTPGDEVLTPTDCEFYFANRIEGRNGIDFRATTDYDLLTRVRHKMKMDARNVRGPCGYSE